MNSYTREFDHQMDERVVKLCARANSNFRARTEDGQALTEVLDGRVAVNRELTSDDLPLNGRRPARKAAQAEPDEDVLVDARRGLKVKPQGKLTPVDLLPAPQLRGQGGEHGESPV